MNIPTQWLHIGTHIIDKEQFKPIKNIPLFPKPDGGIWASPLQLNETYRSDWHQFCMGVWGKTMNQKGVVFSFKRNSRFYVIDTHKDLIGLTEKTGIATDALTEQLSVFMKRSHVDFEKATKLYDVIYLTQQGQYETRTPFQNREYNLYGWDCESCLILNPDVIETQLPISLNKEVIM